ncbi:LA_3334 family protein [Leptospira haakeii]|uniref:30S ribosomal protein S1 n=1 Tax=Leptospira haakeii TaxID=2023198 RepID=A0ABX4PPA3_9LEPT|nr:hypothetical protein [Leptospira haakeii]PKA15874.1 hypothetical protein CH363_10165 [Leptospira haakeii]PKA19394.1 hypothetical protein CH377_12340 [Leptospira haakeii]
MRIFLYLFIFILSSYQVKAAELLLKNGNSYLLDVVHEDDRNVQVNWKGRVYTIPKKEVQKLDYSKKGSQTSYRYSTFILKDGSRIRGVIAEERDKGYTIRTDVGFLEIEKSQIQDMDNGGSSSPDLPNEYLTESVKQPETILGGSLSFLANTAPIAPAHSVTGGAGFFVEPAFLFLSEKYQVGFKTEYLISPGNSNYSFLNAYSYIKKDFGSGESKNWYGILGAGFGSVRYQRGETQVSGVDPLGYVEFGYQGWKLGNMVFRSGLRANCYFESRGTVCMGGLEISLGYRI